MVVVVVGRLVVVVVVVVVVDVVVLVLGTTAQLSAVEVSAIQHGSVGLKHNSFVTWQILMFVHSLLSQAVPAPNVTAHAGMYEQKMSHVSMVVACTTLTTAAIHTNVLIAS